MGEHPIAGVNPSIPMITNGGLEAITRSLAMEYAKEGIRFNAAAPGIVDTPMHATDPVQFLKGLSPMGMISDVDDIVDAILYLTEARHVTGEVLHVDAGSCPGSTTENGKQRAETRLAAAGIELPPGAPAPFGA